MIKSMTTLHFRTDPHTLAAENTLLRIPVEERVAIIHQGLSFQFLVSRLIDAQVRDDLLKLTTLILGAKQAIRRMIREEQLQNVSPNLIDTLRIRPDHHPVCNGEGARWR
jgi:hypothetical protein